MVGVYSLKKKESKFCLKSVNIRKVSWKEQKRIITIDFKKK